MNDALTQPLGRLYGIGLGPGDPELITMKASRLLGRLLHVFAPKADERGASIARSIARMHTAPDTQFHELIYPMTRNAEVLRQHWQAAAKSVVELLATGTDAGFVTLGDPMLYSTCTYLTRAVREQCPSVEVEIVPGVTSFCASAALTEFVLGEQGSMLLVAPAPNSHDELRELTRRGGRLVLMKVGARLPQLVEWVRAAGLLPRARLVSRAGLPGQQIVKDLAAVEDLGALGYLSILLIDLETGGEA